MATRKVKKIEEPTAEQEKELNAVVEDKKETVELGGRKWKIGYLRHGTIRKVTDILNTEKKDDMVNAKCAAALLLNGYFKIIFLHWILWRWFYYVREYTDSELLPVIEACKKKTDVEGYFAVTIYLTEMRDTVMMMTREEVGRIRRGNFGAQPGTSEKSTDASQNP